MVSYVRTMFSLRSYDMQFLKIGERAKTIFMHSLISFFPPQLLLIYVHLYFKKED